MDIIQAIVQGILSWISDWGYLAVFLLMTLESACMPVPSEIVMPFAGFLVYDEGEMTLLGITVVGSLGCTFGSIIAYVAGYYAGRPLIVKYGRYVLITEEHLNKADDWFKKYGPKATFIARLLPVIRTVISLPAGIARMDFKKFVAYSFLGSLPWNFMLGYAGYALGSRWEEVNQYYRFFEYFLVVGIAMLVAWYYFRWRKKKSQKIAKDAAEAAAQNQTSQPQDQP